MSRNARLIGRQVNQSSTRYEASCITPSSNMAVGKPVPITQRSMNAKSVNKSFTFDSKHAVVAKQLNESNNMIEHVS
jgi:hypothetical protein